MSCPRVIDMMQDRPAQSYCLLNPGIMLAAGAGIETYKPQILIGILRCHPTPGSMRLDASWHLCRMPRA